jgi:hypothetical protein
MANNDFKTILNEFDTRVNKILTICDNNIALLTKYFVAILSVCENNYNQHFTENALFFFSFIGYEIESLQFGKLAFVAQEKGFKGFISKQTGTFVDRPGNKKENSTVRLTTCCADYLNIEVCVRITVKYYSNNFC